MNNEYVIKLTNTLTKKEEAFIPQNKEAVSMYICGITPYDYAHIGHGRCYVVFDLLFRLLKILEYKVTYVRNFTDIDDKLLQKAKQDLGDINKYKEIANKLMSIFNEAMKQLGCLSPTFEPKITDHIPEIINFVEELLKQNKAYVVGYNVYFDISSFANYGKLSHRKIKDLLAGARVDIDINKKHPADFALWKGNDQKLFWKSPWGYGRPGWHIECSALARKYLGNAIDIHGGGMDLIFPHHENEIAQSESLTGKTLAQFWVHNAFITVNQEKMSKSLENFFTLQDIFKQYDPMILRYYFLQHHYKTPIDFSIEKIEATGKAYKKLADIFVGNGSPAKTSNNNLKSPIIKKMMHALCEDLNTPKLLGIVFEHIQDLKNDTKLKDEVKNFLMASIGLSFKPILEEKTAITPEIQKLLEKRQQARLEKNWKLADEIRDKLLEMGVKLHDKKTD